jgi:YVTN family beta-propeller protein
MSSQSASITAPVQGRRSNRGASRANHNLTIKLGITMVFVAIMLGMALPKDLYQFQAAAQVEALSTVQGFPYSTPITLNSEGTELWVTNPDPDNNSVTLVNVAGDTGTVVKEIPVGKEPGSIALNADGSRAYVANAGDGTVSVINTKKLKVIETIKVGVEPHALCFTPNFTKLYVACSSSNTLHVINPTTNAVTKVIENPSFSNLFAITITNNGDTNDNDELVYVTNLLAEYTEGSAPKPASDLGKQGVVSVVSVNNDTLIDRVRLKPVKTAFQSDGRSQSADFTPLAATQKADTFAFPNQITSIAGTRQNGTNLIYTFSTGTSPTGPLKFNVEVQSLVALIKGIDDGGQTANLNDDIKAEPATAFANGVPRHRFATMPWGLAFFHNSFKALGVSSACDYVVVINFDQNGKATIAPNGPASITRILTGTVRDPNPDRSIFQDGKAPRGIVINPNDTRAYTFNYVSRDVTIIDLTTNTPIRTVATTGAKGDPTIQLGKELFNTAMGPIDSSNRNADGSVNPIEGRMSDSGWVSCVSCHVQGLTDGVAWSFETGARVSTPLNGTFIKQGQGQRALNWSAVRDEVDDFEKNTRDIAGGIGLIQLANGDADPDVVNLGRPSSGRDGRRDAITAYVKTIRTPQAPESATDPDVQAGRTFFKKMGCAECHSTPLWTTSRVLFTPPPPAGELAVEGGTAQLKGQLVDVGTFNAANSHEVRGAPATLNQKALGTSGFNIPSLLGVHSREKFLLHDGSVTSFEQLFNNPAHVGTNSKLNKSSVRKKIIKFLRSIDETTVPF